MAMLLRLISESSIFSFILTPSVGMVFGLALNRRLRPVPNTLLKAELHGFDSSLEIYCRHSCRRRSSRDSSRASTCRLETGDVLNASRQVRYAAFCTRSRDSRTDC